MTMMKPARSDVQWFLPEAKRAFAGSTRATSLIVGLIAEEVCTKETDMAVYATPNAILERMSQLIPDPEAVEILQYMVDKGFGDTEIPFARTTYPKVTNR